MRRMLAVAAIVVTPLIAMLIGVNLAGRLDGPHGSGSILIAIFAMAGFFIGLALSAKISGTAKARREELEHTYSRL